MPFLGIFETKEEKKARRDAILKTAESDIAELKEYFGKDFHEAFVGDDTEYFGPRLNSRGDVVIIGLSTDVLGNSGGFPTSQDGKTTCVPLKMAQAVVRTIDATDAMVRIGFVRLGSTFAASVSNSGSKLATSEGNKSFWSTPEMERFISSNK